MGQWGGGGGEKRIFNAKFLVEEEQIASWPIVVDRRNSETSV